MTPRLILIRGLPGSGKSTTAETFAQQGFTHIEADQYWFRPDGRYDWRPDLVKHAHQWCREQVVNAMLNGRDIVVANTFTQLWEVQPYLTLARENNYKITIYVATGEYENIHGVPKEAVERMKKRWENIKGEEVLD